MDFLTFYGLAEEPFRITPDAGYFFASRSHHNALLSLEYSADHREGFCLVAGEPGTGKTTLLNVFLEKYRYKAEIAMVLTPRLSPGEFLMAVLEDLGIRCSVMSKHEIIRTFRDFLIQKSLEKRSVIILVDEAQNLPDETLEELRLLSNLETEKEKLLHVILVGQPEIVGRLASPALRQLDQRIVTRIHLGPLDMKEVGDYISFRLTKAGRGHVRFREAAVHRIYGYSRGIPRLINTITTRSLMSAFLEEAGIIQPIHVRYAAQSLKFKEEGGSKRHAVRPVFAAGLALAAVFYFSYLGILKSYFSLTAPSAYAGTKVEETTGSLAYLFQKNRPSVEAPVETTEEPGSSVELAVPSDSASIGEEVLNETAVNEMAGIVPTPSLPEGQDPPALLTAFVTVHTANVRETPGFDGERTDYVFGGQEVRLLNETADVDGVLWYRMDPAQWGSGWISSKVLRIEPGG